MWESALSISTFSPPAQFAATILMRRLRSEQHSSRVRIRLDSRSSMSSACVSRHTRATSQAPHPWPGEWLESARRAAVPLSVTRTASPVTALSQLDLPLRLIEASDAVLVDAPRGSPRWRTGCRDRSERSILPVADGADRRPSPARRSPGCGACPAASTSQPPCG